MSEAGDGADAPDPLLAKADALHSHPAFREAVREHAACIAALRGEHWLISRLVSQRQRILIMVYLLYLDADRERWPRGANYSRLQEVCMRRKEIGPRLLKTMLAVMTLAGMVTVEQGPSDKRLKFYRPTERMVTGFGRQWPDLMAKALDHLQPQARRAQRLRDDPAFARNFFLRAGRDLLAKKPPADYLPELFAFFGVRAGASALTATLILTEMDGTPPISQSLIASRYGLSKAQISNLAAEGIRRGFFASNETGELVATPLLHDSFHRWVSLALAFYGPHMT